MFRSTSQNGIGARHGFTLVEVMLAMVITAFMVGSITMSMSRLGVARSVSKERLDAHLRADGALDMLRRDIASIVRTDDLFFTRFQLFDNTVKSPLGTLDRDELLLFSVRMRPIRDIDYTGEGSVYETQYRIDVDEAGPVLWVRRDALPDEYPLAGGLATPQVEGVLSVDYEAYDGEQWYQEWDSDDWGIPHAVRITVVASGHRNEEDVYEAPTATLRTVVAIDRVLMPEDVAAEADAPLEPDPEETPTIDDLPESGLPESIDDVGGGVDIPTGDRGGGRGDVGGGRGGDAPPPTPERERRSRTGRGQT